MSACPACRTRNEEDARFCVNCGAALPAPKTKPRSRGRATQPLPAQSPFAPRPAGAVFGHRFVAAGAATARDRQHVYAVSEAAGAGSQGWRQCSNPECGAVQASQAATEGKCAQCAAPLSAERPSLVLVEAPARDACGSAFDVAARPPVHAAVRAPIAAFAERVAAAERFCVVAPRVDELPASLERGQVWRWGQGLAQALDDLHALGISFGGRVDAQHLGVAGGHAVWRDFSRCQVGAAVAQDTRSADVRGLALVLYQLATGKSQFSLDATLSLSANSLFSQVLTGSGPVSAAQFTQGLGAILSETATPPGVDYFSGRRTDVGRVRTLNEDAVLALELGSLQQSASRPVGVYAVADGMGGHAAGEVASGVVVTTLGQKALTDMAPGGVLATGNKDRTDWVQEAVTQANVAVFERRQAAGTDMGSTLVLAVLEGTTAYIAHVGDSRAYLVNARGIRRLTADHSLVERLVATRQITREEAQTHPQRNVIYRTMGDRPRVEADMSRQPLAVGDRLLLCSDGLTGKLTDEDIRRIVSEQAASPQDACERLVAAANRAGGDDNISVIVVEIVKA
jgi:serine/threonine protein phosphatase PrpC